MGHFLKVPGQNLYLSLCSVEYVSIAGGPDPDPFVVYVRVPTGQYEFARTTTEEAALVIAQAYMDKVDKECGCCKKESSC